MTRLLAAAAVVAALSIAPAVQAQSYVQPRVSPYTTTGLSPYLNLLRGGNQAVNYYGLVRPELQAQASIQQLQEAVARPQVSVVAPPTNQVQSVTGHTTRFMQYSQYFSTTAVTRPGAPQPPATFGRR
jgi:hypothetical protein